MLDDLGRGIPEPHGRIHGDAVEPLGDRLQAGGRAALDPVVLLVGERDRPVGTLNGGGTSMRFQTFNGSIYIRKAK